jgi:16S rRNA U1498 N3-methylase RsmE
VVEEEVVMFDVPSYTGLLRQSQIRSSQWRIGVVGPEGGLTESDYAHFPHHVVSRLWNTILRMETAAIVGAYELRAKK